MWDQRQLLLVKFREETTENLSPILPWTSEHCNSPIASICGIRNSHFKSLRIFFKPSDSLEFWQTTPKTYKQNVKFLIG